MNAVQSQTRRRDSAPVLIMAGGTGGHIFPGLAAAEALAERGVPVVWMGAAGGLETSIVPRHGLRLHAIRVGGLRGKGWKTRLLAPWMLACAIGAAMRALRQIRPCCVLSMGGFVAGPGGIAAWMSRRPLLVHEQNRVPGVTNKVLARLARRVLVGFEDAFPQTLKTTWVGNPVRAQISALDAPDQRMAQRTAPAHLLVLGGSQGARALNERLPIVLGRLPLQHRPVIWHQCGKHDLDATRAAYAAAGLEARVEPFIEDMAAAYAWADFAVCRAGALTIAELCAAGLGALLVPYPFAVDDHQTRNAEAMRDAGAALITQERDINIDMLSQQLDAVLNDPDTLKRMAMAARTLARPNAAADIAAQCLEVAA